MGDARATLVQAIAQLAALEYTTLVRCSALYRSAPVQAHGPDFINAVAILSTALSAPALLLRMQAMEHAAGRTRLVRNAPRTLDLDLLLYGDASIESAMLTVPHPRMYQRAFVLRPLAEVSPEKVTPQQLQAVCEQRIELLLDDTLQRQQG